MTEMLSQWINYYDDKSDHIHQLLSISPEAGTDLANKILKVVKTKSWGCIILFMIILLLYIISCIKFWIQSRRNNRAVVIHLIFGHLLILLQLQECFHASPSSDLAASGGESFYLTTATTLPHNSHVWSPSFFQLHGDCLALWADSEILSWIFRVGKDKHSAEIVIHTTIAYIS